MNSDLVTPRCKRATFTYIGKETTYITELFKNANLKTAYITNISIELNLKPRVQTTKKYLTSGVHKLTYPDCGKTYIGQTER
jgi:hypothetical protein